MRAERRHGHAARKAQPVCRHYVHSSDPTLPGAPASRVHKLNRSKIYFLDAFFFSDAWSKLHLASAAASSTQELWHQKRARRRRMRTPACAGMAAAGCASESSQASSLTLCQIGAVEVVGGVLLDGLSHPAEVLGQSDLVELLVGLRATRTERRAWRKCFGCEHQPWAAGTAASNCRCEAAGQRANLLREGLLLTGLLLRLLLSSPCPHACCSSSWWSGPPHPRWA